MTQPFTCDGVIKTPSFGQFLRILRYWVFMVPFIISDFIGLVFFGDEGDDF
jgi:hypothetical protein